VIHSSPVAGPAATVQAWRALTDPWPARAGSAPSLAPPRAAPVAVFAVLVGTLLAGLAWHATRLDPVDAWVLRWQVLAHSHASGVAAIVSDTLPAGAMLMTIVAGAALAWLDGRGDAVVLALTAAPATLAAEMLLKGLVHRQWNGDPALVFPSGHLAVATAAAMTAVLVLRVVPGPAPARMAAACLGGGFVLVIAGARLVETVHSLTDVVGGGTTGPVVTLGVASAITARSRRADLRVLSRVSSTPTTRPSPAPARAGRRRPIAPAPSAPRPGPSAPARGPPGPCGGGGPGRRAAR
jgi:membrane-associated phospholipid phosphatase